MEQSSGLVSVVIPTFNRRTSLSRIARPLLDDPGTGEVLFVVDGSGDGSLEFLVAWSQTEPRVRAVYLENSGVGRARQRGIEEARFETIVLLDDDVEAGEGMISAHAAHHAGAEDLLVLGYMPINVDEPRRPGQVTTLLYAEDYENTCRLYERDPNSIFTHLWAGNLSLSRSSALEIGTGIDVRLDYHEDLEFGLRCRANGLRPVFDRSLLASHSNQKTLRRFALECRRSGEGRAYLSAVYPEFADELNPLNALSLGERLVVRLLGSRMTWRFSAPLAMAVSFGSGRARAWRLEMIAARVLRLVELSSGFRAARNGPGR